ncbi:hypothetical protein [Benzoatithermus flavus]|uniref:hypothetical protein n=1 Tax=Benzoatithermus flavus TaxID=3108223 RepID=UPI003AAFCB42
MLEWLLFNVALPLLSIPLIRFVSWPINKNRSSVAILRDERLCFRATTLTAAAAASCSPFPPSPRSGRCHGGQR